MKGHKVLAGLVVMALAIGMSHIVADGARARNRHPGAELGVSAPLVAEGFGAESIGGAGGEIIWVTNLNDNGPGSFREAIAAQGPRIVRFKVGGIIQLEAPIRVENGRLTIDGASAADKGGITLCNYGLALYGLTCRDVIVQHIRVRRASGGGDGIGIGGGAHRILIDHCSVSWADDENFGINKGHYVTVQWCIIAEGLIEGEHPEGGHSMGMLVALGANHVSIHHNFFTGNMGRNALLSGVGGYGSEPAKNEALYMPTAMFDFRSNLLYNFVGGTQLYQDEQVNVLNNYYRYGPSSRGEAEICILLENDFPARKGNDVYYPGCEYPRVYCSGNIGPHRAGDDGDDWSLVQISGEYGSNPVYRSDKPFLVPPVTTQPAEELVELVLNEAGAHPRDDVDLRLIEEYHRGEGKAGYGYLQWKEKHGL